MLKVKRRARGSNGRQKTRKRVKEVSSILSDCEDVAENLCQELCWIEISQELAAKLSPSIVSLASFHGDKMHYKSTGIVIENGAFHTSFLTSSALVCTSDNERRLIHTLKIKVRLPNDLVVDGSIRCYDLPFSMVIVTTEFSSDLCTARFSDSVQVEPHTELLSVKRCFQSGKLMVTPGIPSDSPSEVGTKGFMFSTCKITMDGSGGPLVDFDGNIVGMNDYHDQEGTRYVQGNKIAECLNGAWLRREKIRRYCMQNRASAFKRRLEGSFSQNSSSGATENKKRRHGVSSVLEPQELTEDEPPPELASENMNKRHGVASLPEPQELTEDEPAAELTGNEHRHLPTLDRWPSDDFTKLVNDVLKKDGYPLPKYADGGMHLEGDFEEEFGKDILSEPARRVALKMSRCVVALASYNDTKRHFACTGVLIDCNESTTRVLTSASLLRTSGDETEIIDNLKIEVRLPSKECISGTLQNYDFRYNVAIIGIAKFRNNRAAMLVEAPPTEVVALGRVFKSGNFMATEGLVTGEQSKFDCKELKMSTCKITKAGIGGPLFDFKGNFVGMNFYDTEGTPYLPSNIILEVLRSFSTERTLAGGIAEKPNYSWVVQKPYWYYPSHRPHKKIQRGEAILQ